MVSLKLNHILSCLRAQRTTVNSHHFIGILKQKTQATSNNKIYNKVKASVISYNYNVIILYSIILHTFRIFVRIRDIFLLPFTGRFCAYQFADSINSQQQVNDGRVSNNTPSHERYSPNIY